MTVSTLAFTTPCLFVTQIPHSHGKALPRSDKALRSRLCKPQEPLLAWTLKLVGG